MLGQREGGSPICPLHAAGLSQIDTPHQSNICKKGKAICIWTQDPTYHNRHTSISSEQNMRGNCNEKCM